MVLLFDQIEALKDGYEVEMDPVGIVANWVEPENESKEMMKWYNETFGDHIPVYEVRKRVALKRAWNNGVSTFEHKENCDMKGVFEEIGADLDERQEVIA